MKLYNSRKTRRAAGIWMICYWIHFQAWINHSCIVIHNLLVLDALLHYMQRVPYAQFCRFHYCLAWFDTVEFNCLPCPNNEMYDDAVIADRFRYQLTMFGFRVLIGLSRLLHAHIAYEIYTAKIVAAFCWISYCLHDLIRLNSTVCHFQTTRSTMMSFSMIDCDINWLCLKFVYWYGYLDSLILLLHMK